MTFLKKLELNLRFKRFRDVSKVDCTAVSSIIMRSWEGLVVCKFCKFVHSCCILRRDAFFSIFSNRIVCRHVNPHFPSVHRPEHVFDFLLQYCVLIFLPSCLQELILTALFAVLYIIASIVQLISSVTKPRPPKRLKPFYIMSGVSIVSRMCLILSSSF